MSEGGGVWDAVIVGGGPAGSSVATYLARAGRRVLVLERERFPREHIGESLLPGVLPYLDALGARELVESAGFERKEGQTFIWGRDRTPWEIDFRELDVHPYAYFVDRARFDHLLLEHAARSGAEVRQEHAAVRILFEAGRAVGVEHRDPGGRTRVARARFVVDASGQSALVARGAGLRRLVRGLKNVAIWAYWEGAQRLPGHRRAHILTTSVPEGWIWVIPLGERTSIGVVTSRGSREDRDRLGAEAWYEATLRACEPVRALLEGARRVTDVRAARDWSYRSRRLSGPGILLCGDAACFIDPILSTGVHLAMSSAYWAASVVHSSLEEPRTEPFFRRFYDETYGAMYRELLTQVKAFYQAEGRRDSIYWTSRKVLRVGSAVPADLAFLFITAGLLRNAAAPAPHDPLAAARVELGARAGASAGGAPKPADAAKPRDAASPRDAANVANDEGTTVAAGNAAGAVGARGAGNVANAGHVGHAGYTALGGEAPGVADAAGTAGLAGFPRRRVVSTPLVWRAGASGATQLVTVRADGLRLTLVRHEPRSLHDRPRGSYFVLDLVDAAGSPLALALVEERRATASPAASRSGAPRGPKAASAAASVNARVRVALVPYPWRAHDEALLTRLETTLAAIARDADSETPELRLGAVRARMRKALRDPEALPGGVRAASSREHRGGGVAEPPMTAVFEATSAAPRVYFVLEARVPPELTELPVLRTRHLDLWLRPERSPDGRELARVPEVAALLRVVCRRLWDALEGSARPASRARSFELAERVLTDPDLPVAPFRLLACGRLGTELEASRSDHAPEVTDSPA